jgi:signal transduction histidine kinase
MSLTMILVALGNLFSSDQFLPHGTCYSWNVPLVTLHIISDALIFLSYTTIPFTLWYIVKRRDDLPFNWMFISFGMFIIACGLGHLMEIWTIYNGTFWLSGGVKAITALASVPTAVLLVKLAPNAINIPSTRRLERLNAELQEANAKLREEIEERKRAEEHRRLAEEQRQIAEEMNRMKDQFLAVLSHELRTPLTPVLALTHILKQDDLSTEQKAALSMIEKNIEIEARLIDDLLDITRINRGKISLELANVDMHMVIRSAMDLLRAEFKAKEITLNEELSATSSRVTADPNRMRQVVLNLLKNALKFTPQGGSLTIRTTNDTVGKLQISVVDTGVGIGPDVLPRIFNAFEQGETSMQRTHGGLGLGLAISKSLVEMHGGTITAHSDGRDKGATFTFSLPC